MKTYHQIWLDAHPHRTLEWLKERLFEGFDIHHMDGNHENNDPKNLILLESQDHSNIHDLPFCRIKATEIASRKRKERLEKNVKRGHFHQKKVKGTRYWYFRDNKTKKVKYVGRPNPELDLVIETYNQSPKFEEDWLRALDGLRVLSATFTANAS